MGNVREYFMKRIVAQFPLPKGAQDTPVEWERDYIEALEFYTDRVLEFAAKKIIANRETRTFPLVAECLKACRDTFDELSESAVKAPKERFPEWSAEAMKRADELLVKCVFAKRALERGWILALWDFLREKQRWPNIHEADKIAAKHAKQMKETQEFLADQTLKGIAIHPGVPKAFRMRETRMERLRSLVEA